MKHAVTTRLLIGSLLGLGTLLGGCADEMSEPLLYQVSYSEREALVFARGELEAREATAIQAPMAGPSKVIAWMAPEYSKVKKGDVIVRFDAQLMRQQRRWARGDLSLVAEDLREKEGALTTEQKGILLDMDQVGAEKNFAERFAIDDDRIKSRLEILDDQLDTQFLQSKLEFLDWKNERFSTSAEGAMDVLSVQRQKHSAKIERLDEGLAELEIIAPHDGLITYEANWRGEKPQVGKRIWPGRKVGDLPDVSLMQARLLVLDREAAGLAEEQPVTLWFETEPARKFSATVTSISAAPSSIERGNPQKYYEVTATFAQQHPEQFKLGRGIRAQIRVADPERRIEIPVQSLFRDADGSYVHVYQDGVFERRPVTTGAVTPTHIEITGGLEPGERIALYEVDSRDTARGEESR
ncbi:MULTISPECIES: efflux RND transporter periplasmic adaptor subunit [Microbulbifer]|uniref:efflux RND transporter periplasmic adaptor subunit n=1 Tax=Microbulbifer TaxID=48073 RepID=UPI000831B83B|nr:MULTISPECIES: HlyD family efflux transporter periplasmic adaptor subunit [Microbulbifer]